MADSQDVRSAATRRDAQGAGSSPGTLHVVGTPIGNLGDLSARARETLGRVAVVAAEDTRQTRKLLDREGLTTPLFPCHAHNEASAVPALVARLLEGQDVALVTDAGMPGISDPGEALVTAAREAQVPVTVVPGPSAVTTALILSGLPAGRFVFEGFLPREGKARRRLLRELATERRTLVFYEAPHRLPDVLVDLADLFGADRPAALCRELTKKFEEVRRAPLGALRDACAEAAPQGEITLVVGGHLAAEASAPAPDRAALEGRLRVLLGEGLSTNEASKRLSAELGLPKRAIYELALQIPPQTPR